MNGDIPILHEWNPTQVSAVWLHPFVWLFYKITNSSEQIILIFRYLFTVVWGLSALWVFFRLRKLSLIGSAVASLIFLSFVPYGQQALYYNTFGLITFVFALAIIITSEKHKPVQYAVAGYLFAITVTCCPFLLLLYLILLVAAVVSFLKQKREILHLFLYGTLGTIPAIVIFYLYYIRPSSVNAFICGIPYLLADREHQFTYLGKIIGFFQSIVNSSPVFLPVFSVVLIAILVATFNSSERIRMYGLLVVAVSVIFLDFSYIFMIDSSAISFVFTPIFIGLYCGIFTKDQVAKKIFNFLWVPGLVYMFCINISSTVGFDAEIIPSVVCTMASILLFVHFWKEYSKCDLNRILKKASLTAVIILFATIIVSEMYFRYTFAFGNGRVNDLTVKIEQGPYRNIYCSPSVYKAYSAIVHDLEPIKDSNSTRVLLLTNYWFYLDIERKPISSSCYYPFVDNIFLDQLEEYYKLYPQFIPEVIYVGHNHTDLLERVKNYGYSGNQTELGGYILYRQ